jgi:uncharacterized membrane protein
MPYRWTVHADHTTLTLWPHQSLTGAGFSIFIGSTAAMLTLPLLAVLGTPIVWVLLAFFALPVWGVWRAIMANRRSRMVEEEITLKPGQIRLVHRPAGGEQKTWEANPQWVVVHLRRDGPVENYLTLTGGKREVELGAFLTPEERIELKEDLERRLSAA